LRVPLSKMLCICLLGLIACERSRSGAVHVGVCGKLCGDETKDPRDFTDIDCATEARVRVYAADTAMPPTTGAQPLTERCIDLKVQGTRLSDLFGSPDMGQTAPGPLALDPVSARKVVVEVGLYEPGGAPCPADAPMVALGRSSIIDLRSQDIDIAVPLGCHAACQTGHAVALEAYHLEDNTSQRLPSGMVLGEIFSYEPMLSVNGTCGYPSMAVPRGQFRPFAASRTATGFNGDYAIDSQSAAGCLAVSIPAPSGSGATYACLVNASLSTFKLWSVGDEQHLATLRGIAGDASSGTLVVRIYDRANGTPVGATLTWYGSAGVGDAEYLQEDWMTIKQGSLTATGIAIVRNAPTGSYGVTYPFDPQTGVGESAYFNAGGAEPGSITTIAVSPPPLLP
jgi:hypothetical protein